MIKNEKQYQNAKKLLKDFQEALLNTQNNHNADDFNSLLEMKNQEAMIRRHENEIAEYENLQSGKLTTVSMSMLGEIPEILIKARIAKNWTQADLAARVGLKEQQIQKYESTDYAGASTWKLLFILDALEVNIPTVSITIGKPKFDTGYTDEELEQYQQKLKQRKMLCA